MGFARRAFLEGPEFPALRLFLLDRWVARAAERGETPPVDLSGSCIFCSVFARHMFGGEIRGNERHFHLRTHEGLIVDFGRNSADVMEIAMKGDPYLHDRRLMRSRVVREQIDSCVPRTAEWLRSWREENEEGQRCAA